MHPPSAHSATPSDGLAADFAANDPRGWLSALADGQADATEPACGLWRDDAAARQTWHAYHLIGDVLRSEELAREPGRDAAFVAALRADIAELGLARDDAMSETEDHIAYLCEVMRYLIAGDDVAVANLTRQQAFFATHVQPWAQRMCEALQAHPKARFYAAVAALTSAFLAVEAQGFDMLD
jgi:TorA maturation chaperone TorD